MKSHERSVSLAGEVLMGLGVLLNRVLSLGMDDSTVALVGRLAELQSTVCSSLQKQENDPDLTVLRRLAAGKEGVVMKMGEPEAEMLAKELRTLPCGVAGPLTQAVLCLLEDGEDP